MAIVVVIEKGNSRPHRLGQHLLAQGAGDVLEMNAGLFGDVGEAHLGRIQFDRRQGRGNFRRRRRGLDLGVTAHI